jgi:protein-disulfide isomerase
MNLQRRTLVYVLSGVAVAAAALAVTLVLVSRGGGSEPTTTAAATTATRSALLAGIPQRGLELGDPTAPPLYEYADIQCPYCAEFSNHVLPSVIRDYVRTGKVKLVFHGLAFIGPDSTKALRAVESAGLQDRLWDVLDAVYARQGQENAGWVTDGLLQEVGARVSGLDTGRWLDETGSDAVTTKINEAADAATTAGVRSTPSFVFQGQLLQLQSLDPADFKAALDPLLGE